MPLNFFVLVIFTQMLLDRAIVKLQFKQKSQFHVNLCAAPFFFASTALMVTFEESQFQTISDISPLFSDTQLRGKIKFKRLQTKLTIAEKLGTGKTTDTVHSTVLRKNYRLVWWKSNWFKFKF